MNEEITPVKYGLLIGLIFILLAVCSPEKAFAIDMEFWAWWSAEIKLHGIGEVYNHGSNYPPLIHYFFWLYAYANDTLPQLTQNVRFVKVIPLAFDFIGALSILLLMKRDNRNWLTPLFLLFNIAYLYNSYFWGQLDSIHTALTVLAFIFALKERPALSLVFYVLAINMKIQSIILFPLLGLAFIPALVKQPAKVLLALIPATIVQVAVLIPFILAGNTLQVWQVPFGSIDYYQFISLNAFNFWHLLLTESQMWGVDTQLWAGVTYKSWGIILFLLASTISLMPLLLITINSIRRNDFTTEHYRKIFFLSAGLIAVVFFYFNTQMHERYSHPAMILLFIFGWYSRSYATFALVSVAYLLNMEKICRFLELNNYRTFIFDPKLVAVLYLLAIVIGVYQLYKNVSIRTEVSDLRIMFSKKPAVSS